MTEARPQPKSLTTNFKFFLSCRWFYYQILVIWYLSQSFPESRSQDKIWALIGIKCNWFFNSPHDCCMKVHMNYSFSEQPMLEEEEKKLYLPAPVSHWWKLSSICRSKWASHYHISAAIWRPQGRRSDACTMNMRQVIVRLFPPEWLKPTQNWCHRSG